MKLSKSKISLFSQLSSKKMRLKHGLFIAEGEKSVSDTIGHYSLEALVATEEWLGTTGLDTSGYSDRVLTADMADMRKISSLSTAPEVIAVYRLPETTVQEIDSDGLNLLLDGVQDPGNLGTIIRTAHWFGVRKIFASRDTVDVYNPKTVQSTMGSIAHVEVCYCDLGSLIENHPDMEVYGTLLEGDNIYDTSLETKGFIIMGNEGKGISPGLRTMIKKGLNIPPFDQTDHSESLNVAIATAVVLSQFRSRDYKY